MTHSIIHRDFESNCRQVIGWTIEKVEYTEIDYYKEEPQRCYKTQIPEINTVDFSVKIVSADNNEAEFFWDDEFYFYGVGCKVNEKSPFGNHRIWDVSQDDLWRDYIGTKIIDLKILWDETWIKTNETGVTNFYTYPLGIELTFSNEKQMIIAAGEFKNNNYETAQSGMDNLLVTPSRELALKTQMIFANASVEQESKTGIWKKLFG